MRETRLPTTTFTSGAVALVSTPRNPALDTAIVAVRRPDRDEPIVAAAGLELTSADSGKIEAGAGRQAA